jgi:O-antigen ligase
MIALIALLALTTVLIWVDVPVLVLSLQAGLLVVAAVQVARNRKPKLRHWLLALPAVFGFVQCVAGLSADPTETLRRSLHWLALAAIYSVAFAELQSTRRRRRVLASLALAAILLVAFSMAQFFTSAGKIFWIWPAAEPNVFGPFQSRNNFASFVLLFLPIVLYEAVRNERQRLWWLAGGAILLSAAVASGSRAGAGLAAIELVVLGILLRDHLRTVLLPAALMAAICIGVGGWELLSNKVGDVNPLRHRKDMWISAAEMIRQQPWSGFGLGAFPSAYPAFARFDSGHFVNHAHNDWLEWGAEGGLPLLLLLAGFAVWILPSSLRSVWGIGVPAVCLHAFVDYPMQRLGVAGWVVLLAAAVAAHSASQRQHPKARTRQSVPVEQVPSIEQDKIAHGTAQVLPSQVAVLRPLRHQH